MLLRKCYRKPSRISHSHPVALQRELPQQSRSICAIFLLEVEQMAVVVDQVDSPGHRGHTVVARKKKLVVNVKLDYPLDFQGLQLSYRKKAAGDRPAPDEWPRRWQDEAHWRLTVQIPSAQHCQHPLPQRDNPKDNLEEIHRAAVVRAALVFLLMIDQMYA